MPMLPKRPCPVAGCPVPGPCPVHRRPVRPQPAQPVRLYDDRRGSSTQRGYGYAWQQRRKEYIKQHPFCVRCGKPTTDVDHKLARRFGGSEDDSNLQALCGSCHKAKTARERRVIR
jgi:5-methylcytosine-specific restriction protein A